MIRALLRDVGLLTVKPDWPYQPGKQLKHTGLILQKLVIKLTLFPHSHLEAFLQPTVLALVAMVLVNGTVAVAATRVAQVPADAPLEEALATCVIGQFKKQKEITTLFLSYFINAQV